MKNGYQRLLVFEIILFIILFINSFVWNILNNYMMVIFLVLITIIFKLVFGFEKDRHRYIKDIIFDIIILLLVSFLIYYLFGILIGFYKAGNYYNLYSIRTIFIPLILNIILKEYLRYQMITKSEGSKLLNIITCLFFIFIDISSSIYFADFSSSYSSFTFIALTFLPIVSRNIVSCYIAGKIGYKPNILWIMVTELYIYLLPIIPNPNEYILSLIRFMFPLFIMYKIYSFFKKTADEQIERNYKKSNKFILIIPTIIVIILVYFTSGYFNYYAVAIASGSMTPNINKGDVVVIEKIDKYDNLEIGEVLAYNYDGKIIVHRIINIIEEDGNYYFYTKGDNNNSEDNFAVYEDMIVGVVNIRLPFIGYPTVWFNEL